MNFEEILDHAIAMLQRRGRITYRTLKRQFQLDDAALEDLKEELMYGQRLAVDEDGRVLVWMGEEEPPATPHTRVASLAVEPRPIEAERRQLTVLFCDLVDSTALQATGQRQGWPYYLALLAEAYGRGGDDTAGLQRLAAALAVVDDTEECWWEAELYRLKGKLLRPQATGSSDEDALYLP